AADVADRVFRAAFANNGQICSAVKRVYVPEKIYDDVVEAMATHAKTQKVGDGMDPETQLGPINNKPQYERVSELVADAIKGGAEVAERLECGTAWANTHLALAPHQPFGGAKWSGLGVENGPWGLYGFTELQVLHRAKR